MVKSYMTAHVPEKASIIDHRSRQASREGLLQNLTDQLQTCLFQDAQLDICGLFRMGLFQFVESIGCPESGGSSSDHHDLHLESRDEMVIGPDEIWTRLERK